MKGAAPDGRQQERGSRGRTQPTSQAADRPRRHGHRRRVRPRHHPLHPDRARALDRLQRRRRPLPARERPRRPARRLGIDPPLRRQGQRRVPQRRLRPLRDGHRARLLAPAPEEERRRPLHHALRRLHVDRSGPADDPQHHRRRTRPDPQPRRQTHLLPLEPARRPRRLRHLLQPPARRPLAEARQPRQEDQQRVRRVRSRALARRGGADLRVQPPEGPGDHGDRAPRDVAGRHGRAGRGRLRPVRRRERHRARARQSAARSVVPAGSHREARRQPRDGEGRRGRAPLARQESGARRPLVVRPARRPGRTRQRRHRVRHPQLARLGRAPRRRGAVPGAPRQGRHVARRARRQERRPDRRAQQRNVRPGHRDDRARRGLRTDQGPRAARAAQAGDRLHRQGAAQVARRLAIPAHLDRLRHVRRRLAGHGALERPQRGYRRAGRELHARREVDGPRGRRQAQRPLRLHRPRQERAHDGRGDVRPPAHRRRAPRGAAERVGRLHRLARPEARHQEPEPLPHLLRLARAPSAAGDAMAEVEPLRQAAPPGASGNEGRRDGHVARRDLRQLVRARHRDRDGGALARSLLPLPPDVQRQGPRAARAQEDNEKGRHEEAEAAAPAEARPAHRPPRARAVLRCERSRARVHPARRLRLLQLRPVRRAGRPRPVSRADPARRNRAARQPRPARQLARARHRPLARQPRVRTRLRLEPRGGRAPADAPLPHRRPRGPACPRRLRPHRDHGLPRPGQVVADRARPRDRRARSARRLVPARGRRPPARPPREVHARIGRRACDAARRPQRLDDRAHADGGGGGTDAGQHRRKRARQREARARAARAGQHDGHDARADAGADEGSVDDGSRYRAREEFAAEDGGVEVQGGSRRAGGERARGRGARGGRAGAAVRGAARPGAFQASEGHARGAPGALAQTRTRPRGRGRRESRPAEDRGERVCQAGDRP